MESAELKAARQKLDTESTAIGNAIAPIAARLDALSTKLESSMTPEEQSAAAANVQADADALETAAAALVALGSEPTPPTP